ncbi:30S ribosomal protein S13 [Candidatus Woesearchaeota archaeon]|nr:30S ribosomal protein S13 [Candidatus Woesearchaeota archaeon]
MLETHPGPLPASFKHIVRIANVDLPGQKQIHLALTGIKGLGINFADSVCLTAGIDKTTKTGTLNDEQIKKLNEIVNNPAKYNFPPWMLNRRKDYDTGADTHFLTGTLTFTVDNDIKRQKKIKSYVGVRHIHGQPVRGQRTRSNFRKNKGKVVGVVKKKETAPAAAEEKKGK